MADKYVPKNILITGGLGFIASHVVINLSKYYPDYNIIVLDKLDICASRKNLEGINVKIIIGNILSPDLVYHILEEYKIDTIMHFAAQTHVDNSFGNSLTFTENNMKGTHVLLETVKHAISNKVIKLGKFIHVSTDEVYGETTTRMSEDMVLSATNPYAATKAAAEFLAKSYHTSFGIPIIITRGNNVYGPHQYPEKIVPKFINLLLLGEPCSIHGDGSHTRSFLFVKDVAEAFIILLHRGIIGEIYNIGTEFEISNLNVAKDLIRLIKKNENYDKYLKYVEDRKFNDHRYHIDTSKMKILGWNPKVHWNDGLRLTMEWYMANKDHWNDISEALVPHNGKVAK